jgi:hypothetical protein
MTTEDDKKANANGSDDKKNVSADDKSDKSDDLTKQAMIPKTRFDQVNEQRKTAEAELQQVADEMKKDIPEEYADLVPDLSPSKLIAWIRNAHAKGLFDPKTSADSLDSKRPKGKQEVTDFEGMSPQAIMATGYGTKK